MNKCIEKLTDKQLLNKTAQLVRIEHECTAEIINHLIEIEKRKLYSDLKLSSLWSYCIEILQYSEAQTSRRLSVLKLAKRMPKTIKMIKLKELNLTTAGMLNAFINAERPCDSVIEALLNKIKNRNAKETEEILRCHSTKNKQKINSIRIEIGTKTLQKLEKVRGLLAHQGHIHIEEIFDYMLDTTLKEIDPALKNTRDSLSTKSTGRYINAHIRKEVFKRAHGKCENCGSMFAPEVDHIIPYAQGGSNKIDNLRLLCKNCNQRAGIKQFGVEKMKRLDRKIY